MQECAPANPMRALKVPGVHIVNIQEHYGRLRQWIGSSFVFKASQRDPRDPRTTVAALLRRARTMVPVMLQHTRAMVLVWLIAARNNRGSRHKKHGSRAVSSTLNSVIN